MNTIVIIGAGLAGYTVARELRKLDKASQLIIVTADNGGFYSKPMLSNAMAFKKQAAQLVTQTAEQMASQLAARIITGVRVESLDTIRKIVDTGAESIAYDKLVLAVGAQPIRLPLAGDAADQVLSVNHLDDYAVFQSGLSLTGSGHKNHTKRITILGAGLIGCEFADDLSGAGHAVSMIDPNSLPLAALAAPALSEGLKSALLARGVNLQLGTTAAAVDHAADGLRITLANGATLAADIVLSAVGLRPNLGLAQAADLWTQRGILVDPFGRTSAPDVYALGDCAEYTSTIDGSSRTLPYIAPLMTAARAIARTLTGQPTAIDLKPAPVIVKTPCYPLALLPPLLHLQSGGRWQDDTDVGATICRFYDAQGIMIGFGVAPQEAGIRQRLMAALGNPAVSFEAG